MSYTGFTLHLQNLHFYLQSKLLRLKDIKVISLNQIDRI